MVSLVISLVACAGAPQSITAPTQTAQSAIKTLGAYPFLTPSATQTIAEVTALLTQSPQNTQVAPSVTPQPTLKLSEGYQLYFTIAGETLPAVAAHFGVEPDQVLSLSGISAQGYLPVGTELGIPLLDLGNVLAVPPALPDDDIVYGPGTADFDLFSYAQQVGGFLIRYRETVNNISYTGPEIVQMVARDTSTNPRLLLALLDYRAHWVTGDPPGADKDKYPIGFGAGDSGLYNELLITARFLTQGFYGWRDGSLTILRTFDAQYFRIDPRSNAGSVAIQNLFATLFNADVLYAQLYGEGGFLDFYQQQFGDPWARAELTSVVMDETVQQPELVLPFLPGLRWSLTAGAHTDWHTGTPRGALDFAPVTGEAPCAVSEAWVTAAANGLVVRSENGVVAIDLDGDGDEGTGWVLIYLHVAEKERVALGTWVEIDSQIGHPSCERGHSTGTHMHITRKYNGQWLGAEGALPLVLSGWQAYAGVGYYEGTLQRDGEIVRASSSGMTGSSIFRD